MTTRVVMQPQPVTGGTHAVPSQLFANPRPEDSGLGGNGRSSTQKTAEGHGERHDGFQKAGSLDIFTEDYCLEEYNRTTAVLDQQEKVHQRAKGAVSIRAGTIRWLTIEADHSNRMPPSNISVKSSPQKLALLRAASEDTSPMVDFGNESALGRNGTHIRPGSFDFLPTVNFDEFHRSIKSYDLDLGQPVPADNVDRLNVQEKVVDHGVKVDKENREDTAINPSVTRLGRTESLRRRQANTVRQNNLPSPNHIAGGLQNAPTASRAQRESYLRPNLRNTAVRTSRKSVGPGVLETIIPGARAQLPRQLTRPSDVTPNLGEQGDPVAAASRRVNHAPAPAGSRNSRSELISRNDRVKSLQPSPKGGQENAMKFLVTPDRPRPPSTGAGRLWTKSPGLAASNFSASSSSKRLSVVPPHATGLGARTISPTDARRMKRLSMLSDRPPVPPTPPTPHPDTPEFRSAAQSPCMIPRKSVTPSSSRTTPDCNRKSYASGLSMSSSSNSYTSARTSTGSLQPRANQSTSTSRLPTPKPRNVHSSASGQGVPPIPAIPKAYESPKDVVEVPFFTRSKSSSSPHIDKDTGVERTSEWTRWKGVSVADDDPPVRPALITSASSDAHVKARTASIIQRKHLQPLRLPPLNLLPLSTPTVAKVAALQGPYLEAEEGRSTPHPKRGRRTPTTPLTASKASFVSKGKHHEELMSKAVTARSSSSNLFGNAETASLRAASSSGSSIPTRENILPERQRATPLGSSSLPRTAGDVYMSKASADSEEGKVVAQIRGAKVNGPRSQTLSAVVKDDALVRPVSPMNSSTPSSASSLRRKWSLSFRRSSSKASLLPGDRDSAYPPPPLKHDDMPPPRLPASATLSGALVPSPTPLTKPSYLEVRNRKGSGASQLRSYDSSQMNVWSNQISSRGTGEAGLRSDSSSSTQALVRTQSTTSTPAHKALSSKPSSGAMQNGHQASYLDRDDLAAEDEMRKLAAKRKDFEAAANELDHLRKMATPKDRVAPAQALRVVNLNIFERGEIVDYKEVYFCGTQNAKKHVGDLNGQAANFGYDDERGDYNIINGDHLAYRYEIIDILGKGSFGQVVRCVDHKCGGLVAVKIIRNKKRFHQQALVEVNILRKLREWDPNNKHSMVNFTQSFYFRGHLCISTELLGMNLYEFIKVHEFRGFSLKLIRRFTKQLLSSLVLLHSHRIIHCDLKPENVLLAHPMHADIKVIDFGSSCFESAKVYTYIQSRFYRSPEVILGMTYGMPIDIWSLGCILAELYTGYPIFPGENEQEQLACIMEVFGPPEKHLIEKSTRKKLFFDSLGKPRLTVSSKGRRRRPSSKTLQQALKCDEDSFVDLIARCLRWDPDRRMKPEEALQHDFLTGVKKPLRSRTQQTVADSLVKRVNTVHTSTNSRPLPDPPVVSLKSSNASRSKELPAASPSMPSMARRHSTFNGLQSTVGVKRTSTGIALGSGLPRVAPRSLSNKGELATAAAAVATMAQRR